MPVKFLPEKLEHIYESNIIPFPWTVLRFKFLLPYFKKPIFSDVSEFILTRRFFLLRQRLETEKTLICTLSLFLCCCKN